MQIGTLLGRALRSSGVASTSAPNRQARFVASTSQQRRSLPAKVLAYTGTLPALHTSTSRPSTSSLHSRSERSWEPAPLQSVSARVACPALPSTPVWQPAAPETGSSGFGDGDVPSLKPLPRAVENIADDPALHNPLQRAERLGTGWMGVIVEFEGIVVQDTSDLHTTAWLTLAEEEGKPRPLQFAVKRAEGMKNEQVIQEVFCWSRNPMEVRRLAARKEDLYRELRGDSKPVIPSGTLELLAMLAKHNVPVALACSAPEARVRDTLDSVALTDSFSSIVTAEDVYRGRPDPESYLYAAQQIGRPPARCVVIGNSNQSVEAARECGMQCVVVAGRHPVYELTAADLVVRQLDELSFVNLKQLFRMESMVASQLQEEMEEEDEPAARVLTQTLTRW